MEGTENSSNSGAGSQTESKSTESKATESKATETSKSSGNFSGGFDSSALSDKSLSTDSTPDFGVDFGSNNNKSKSFGFGDNVTTAPDLSHDNRSNRWDNIDDYERDVNGTYSFIGGNNRKPVMTVDEVYGKGNQSIVERQGNQSIVERQGDYAASSNEKSGVETSTFGKQDEISVTPLSVTEDKGLVNNDAIQSVEGLDFQQKDKAQSQDVLEAKKNRDEAEAEDKTNRMKDSLLANIGKPIGKPGNGDVSQFQLGDRNEDVAAAKAEVDRLANEKTEYEKEQASNAGRLKSYETEVALMKKERDIVNADYQAQLKNNEQLDTIGQKMQEFSDRYQEIANKDSSNPFNRPSIQMALRAITSDLNRFKSQLGVDAIAATYPNAYQAKKALEGFKSWENDFRQKNFEGLKDFSQDSIMAYRADIDAQHRKTVQGYTDDISRLERGAKELENRQKELQGLIADNKKKSDEAKTAYDNLKNSSFVGEETPATTTLETPVEETPATTTAEVPSDISSDEAALNELRDDINNSDLSPKQKDELNGVLTDIEQSKLEVIEAAAKARSGNQADLVAYENATRKHTNNLTAALNMGNAITQTDLNRKFTKRIADANDFMVTREDGTQQSYADFATEEASKSPDYAEAIYNQQSEDYANKAATATNGIMKTYYNVKSELASWKAQLAKDWLGSKFIGADNAFRNTFIQMAETDERATVNTCNNILKDKTGKYSEADKKEALEELNQSKTLMTAATALKYSTGPFSGIDDDLKDGTYGTTNPKELKLHQKIISKVDNIAKIALGLVVTPAANEGWSNLYYLAGDKASQSNLFNRDWDKDGISMTREYGNNATAGMIGAVCELGLGVALMFNPSTTASGANLVVDSIKTFINSLYGVRKAAKNAVKANNEILGYFNEARDIVKSSGNEKAIKAIDDATSMLLTQTKQTEDFQLKSDEVGNLDNWLEGSGSNTADNGKFNQALTYDEWLKLIEADPVMREYAKSLNR